jgi:tRNA (cmo5U34)-methyltransferase
MGSKRDVLFNSADSGKSSFRFNAAVASVFDNMINRSVPLYETVQTISSRLACQYYMEGTSLFDIGCSTGLSLKYLNRELKQRKMSRMIHYIGLDKSSDMCKRAKKRSGKFRDSFHVEIQKHDILEGLITGASVVLCHYTIQFLKPEEKRKALVKIYDGLLPGGLLILSDKIEPDECVNEPLFLDAYDRFKLGNGYSELEITEKRKALNGVLIPIKAENECEIMRSAGFERVETIIKWFQFATFIAFKPGL